VKDTFLDFQISKNPATGGFEVRLVADAWQAQAAFGYDLENPRLNRVVQGLEANQCSLDNLRDIGIALWSGLMAGEVGKLFEGIRQGAGLQESKPDGGRARFLFRLTLPPELEPLPWEALHFERGFGFLSSLPDHTVVRAPSQDIDGPAQPPMHQGPVRVLAVAPAGSGLDLEWNNLDRLGGLLPDRLQVQRLGGRVTPDLLRDTLRLSRSDVLHFSGHGELTDVGGTVIRLNDEDGRDRWLDGEAFSHLLVGTDVRLAVLNCRMGGSAVPHRSMSGLGPFLLRAGVPAIVAMRYEITDAVAIRFAERFYSELLGGLEPGRVDLALEHARESIFINQTEDVARDFVTPALYLAPGCEQLFALDVEPRRGFGREGLAVSFGSPPRQTTAPLAPMRRTPHLGFDPAQPLAPESLVDVEVWADQGSMLLGQRGDDAVVETTADEVQIDVWLTVSAHFAIEGRDSQPLTLFRGQSRTTSAKFQVHVRTDAVGVPGIPRMTAHLSHEALPCGHVSSQVAIAGMPNFADEGAGAVGPLAAVKIDASAAAADLQVRIVGKPGDTTGQRFQCRVTSGRAVTTGGWVVPLQMPKFVAASFSEFIRPGTTASERRAALCGAGLKLFEATPQVFREALQAALSADPPPKTISIVTQDPYFPWELAVPAPPPGHRPLALGVRFQLSRWTARDGVHAPQAIALNPACVVAPKDSGLKSTEAEVATLENRFPPVHSVVPATFDQLDEDLGALPPALLHFVCHGESRDTGGQVLKLEGTSQLAATSLAGMDNLPTAISGKRPLVFLNACKVGRLEPDLCGAGGFAEELMSLGAAAVVAPLWSVKDSIAHLVAEEFYLRAKTEPFAEILRDLRSRAYLKPDKANPTFGEDSWAAYCFYGDPRARYLPPSED
jgi:CHAT domain-containing protein